MAHNIAIFGSCHKVSNPDELVLLLDTLNSFAVNIYWEETYVKELYKRFCIKIKAKSYFNENNSNIIDYALSLGGDGTFLRVSRIVKHHNIPILGINMGRLGFLTDVDCIGATEHIHKLFSQEHTIEKRMLLNIIVNGMYQGEVLNEISLLKRETGSMINIKAFLDNAFLADYDADGLVIATSTGSTAYSLSAGGPIIVPQSGCVVITPIAPHTLTMRPIVISENSRIRLTPHSRNDSYLISLDGQTFIAPSGSIIEITKSENSVNMVHLNGRSFVDTIREKLMWGTSPIENVR